MKPPRPFSALPSVISHEASPKAISRRTSYIPVRLEFLRYPQVIHHHCNGGWFGPPWGFTPTSTCSCVGHPVSGLWHTTYRPCQTRSRFGFRPQVLNHAAYHNSPDHSTKGTISHIDVLYVLVSTEFQVLFTPLPGFFSPFLHSTIRYRSLSSI